MKLSEEHVGKTILLRYEGWPVDKTMQGKVQGIVGECVAVSLHVATSLAMQKVGEETIITGIIPSHVEDLFLIDTKIDVITVLEDGGFYPSKEAIAHPFKHVEGKY